MSVHEQAFYERDICLGGGHLPLTPLPLLKILERSSLSEGKGFNPPFKDIKIIKLDNNETICCWSWSCRECVGAEFHVKGVNPCVL